MNKYIPVVLAVVFLSVVWGVYYYAFGSDFSTDQGVWGTFGDYTGGILNPLLNFITIYLLIKSFNSQEEALQQAVDQAEQAKSDLAEARYNERLRAFEGSLFNFAEMALVEYRSLRLKTGLGRDEYIEAGESVAFLQRLITQKERSFEEACHLINDLDERSHGSIYSTVKAFCALFKIVKDLCPEGEHSRYVDMITIMLPVKVHHLLGMAEAYSKWPILNYPRELGFFEKESIRNMVSQLRSVLR
ncbi:hypothetical protein D3C77_170550 [compost metagenome]